jgi:hypothetical protein
MPHIVVDQSAGGDDKPNDNSLVTRQELFTILKQISNVSKFYELEVFEVLDIFRIGGTIIEPGIVKGRYLKGDALSGGNSKEKVITFKPLNSNILQYPVVGELWLAINYTIGQSNAYYLGRVGKDSSLVNDGRYWNESAKGEERAIDTLRPGSQVLNSNRLKTNYAPGVKFTNITPKKLLAEEGDTIIQGRFGNTIRLGSNQREGDGFQVSPNIKLVSGLISGEEDLDDDKSSIYLTSNEIVDYANPAFSAMDNNYSNSQITIDSDRLVLNAKKDVIGIFAQKDININSVEGDVFIHANDKISLKPKNSTIEMDISESGNGKIINVTKEGIPFPQLDMAGFLKQTMGIQKLFQAFALGVPKLSNPLTLPSGVKDIVKGLEGAKNFVDATLNLEFLSQALMETKTLPEIKASLPIPAGLLNIVGDIEEFSKDIEGGIQKAQKFAEENEAKLEQANQISAGIDSGNRKDLLNVLENISEAEIDSIPGAKDALAIARDKSVGSKDLQRARENGVFGSIENYIAEQGSVKGDVEQVKMYGKILNLTKQE